MTGRELNIIHLFTRGHKKALLSHIEHKALTSAQQQCNTFQYPINFCSVDRFLFRDGDGNLSKEEFLAASENLTREQVMRPYSA